MRLKLSISVPGSPELAREQEYDQDVVTIGRSARSDLRLEGGNSVVSRDHARILREGQVFKLVDLNSMNATELNDAVLAPQAENELHSGDRIQICDFKIEVTFLEDLAVEEPPPEPLPPPRPNPFLKETAKLAAVLKRLSSAYGVEEASDKEKELRDALREALPEPVSGEAKEIVIDYLGGRKTMEAIPPPEKGLPPFELLSGYDRVRVLIDQMLDFLMKLTKARIEFKRDFMKDTIITAKSVSLASVEEAAAYLEDCRSAEEIKACLFDAHLTPEEVRIRAEALSIVHENLLLHQVALLEGYKAAVREGTKRLLGKISPKRIQELLGEKKLHLGFVDLPYGAIPLVRVFEMIKLFAEVHGEIAAEDLAKIEETFYRIPGYIPTYNNCTKRSRWRLRKAEQ